MCYLDELELRPNEFSSPMVEVKMIIPDFFFEQLKNYEWSFLALANGLFALLPFIRCFLAEYALMVFN